MIAVFQSRTTGYRVQKELVRRGEKATVIQTPADITRGGCSFSLRVQNSAHVKLVEVLKAMGVKNVVMYTEVQGRGRVEYREIR